MYLDLIDLIIYSKHRHKLYFPLHNNTHMHLHLFVCTCVCVHVCVCVCACVFLRKSVQVRLLVGTKMIQPTVSLPSTTSSSSRTATYTSREKLTLHVFNVDYRTACAVLKMVSDVIMPEKAGTLYSI